MQDRVTELSFVNNENCPACEYNSVIVGEL